MLQPWISKLEEEMREYNEKIVHKEFSKLRLIKKFPKEQILKRAISHKKYDIYHSTTIEGYEITPEEVEAIIFGKKHKEKEPFNKLRNRMAVMGHAQAFEYVIKMIKKDFGRAKITEDLISEIYFKLFKPSVDAKIIDRFDLVGYRKIKVFIRGCRYVPPASEKVQDLMKAFISHVNEMQDSIIKAILAHYFFATIHPYPDGNGRCARLLMNYLLAASGYPWVTIPVAKRDAYFQSLQKGQLESEIIPFAKFILSFLKK